MRYVRRRLVGRRWFVLTAVLLGVNASVGAASAFGATVADWQMNEPAEPPEQTVMADSSGSGLNGTIGSAVATGVVTNGETGYRWFGPDPESYHPERLVTVQSSLLNPGTDDYVVTLRLYTGAGDQNIIQKGQATTYGGYWKIDMKYGKVICLYKGSEGRSAIRSTQTVWDNAWHTIRCERTATRVTLTIDGGTPRSNVGATGRIANSKPLAIGGKYNCNPPTVQCDYYIGRLGYVTIEKPSA